MNVTPLFDSSLAQRVTETSTEVLGELVTLFPAFADTYGLYPEWKVSPSKQFLKFLDEEVKQK